MHKLWSFPITTAGSSLAGPSALSRHLLNARHRARCSGERVSLPTTSRQVSRSHFPYDTHEAQRGHVTRPRHTARIQSQKLSLREALSPKHEGSLSPNVTRAEAGRSPQSPWARSPTPSPTAVSRRVQSDTSVWSTVSCLKAGPAPSSPSSHSGHGHGCTNSAEQGDRDRFHPQPDSQKGG